MIPEASHPAHLGALLRRLSAHDERWLGSLFASAEKSGAPATEAPPPALDRRTRMLVELAALLAVDAPTSCLRWAAERAAATGADDEMLVYVLKVAASTAGTARAVAVAPRLALAIDLDTDVPDG